MTQAMFDKFDINSVEMLRRVGQHWYVFSELRTTVGGESPIWYWIPLMQQKDRWIAGRPSTLSVTE